ncbi:subclass B3 metallo-beta-lactamase [Alteriqipengyuania lutimaris]|uniref:Subclass B3 metallo-beta-lactamase n=1 Tax=Alteriqipengyuania lutimaris TaxID=1538146 RepID=A0A395LGL7_9SPHN|nr:subclass B3 metallo-beta-lactamase [Alteriqipengyuania lutimaris]MBB3035129.1 metallo-beta-lactamase class B [Alteriqipengyuania lutimaris]RDS75745.1 subclass B3 metallo-beta-lactamase [Alteriqipengyuania lutimaris]
MSVRICALAAMALALSGCAPASAPAQPATAPGTTEPSVLTSIERGTGFSQAAFLEACEDWDDWAKPAPPFELLGDTWYVGTCGIAAILIVGEEGHVLIDSGTEEGAPLILDNIRALGLDPRDVRYLLLSHEHFDHVGGHAALAEATGAQVIASPEAAKVLASGKVSSDDPQAAMHPAMTPVKVDRIVSDGEVLRLGDKAITAHLTPGHTPGAMSWTWNACSLPWQPPVCRRIAYVDSLSPVSADEYRFSDHPAVVAGFKASIPKVAQLPCDMLVTPHPSASKMLERMRAGTLLGGMSCADYALSIGDRLDKRLAEEGA